MADRNRNGIDDSREKYGPGQPISKTAFGRTRQRADKNPIYDVPIVGPFVRARRDEMNLYGDLGKGIASALGFGTSTKPNDAIGGGVGDQLFGVPSDYYAPYNAAAAEKAAQDRAAGSEVGRALGGAGLAAFNSIGEADGPGAKQPSLLDFLSQAGGIVDQLGIGQGGGGPSVDYSGAMSQARSTRDRNSAYLAALYNQLRGGLAEDRESIASNYGGAIDRSQEIAQTAQEATRAAYDSAQAKQDSAVSALGMQQAAASQELDRPTTQQQAADAISDSAARAQNAQTLYNSQQANATTHNKNVEGASRFSEVRAQGDLDASLAERLDEYARLQAEANAQAAASARSGQSERASSILSLAQNLYGDSRSMSQQDFENQLSAAKIANDQPQPEAPGYTLEQLLAGQEASGLNTQDYTSFMKLLAQLNR